MANLVKLANGGVTYAHLIASPDERTRDIVWGGDGNDFIIGDNETWAVYPPDFGFGDLDYNFGIRGPAYWSDPFTEFEETEENIERIADNMDDQEDDDYYFVKFNPKTGTGSHDPGQEYPYDELLIGGDGNDTVWGLAGNDWIVGGKGNDWLFGGSDHDMVEGGSGNDFIFVSDTSPFTYFENDVALGGDGDDQITIDLGDYADGGDGFLDKLIVKNVVQASTFDFYLQQNEGSYTKNFELLEFHGSDFADVVKGAGKNDVLYGNDGNDILEGRFGHDELYGGAGVDFIYGGWGSDMLSGGRDSDVIYDDEGDDEVWGDDGGDIIWTGEGNDTVHGGLGDDIIGEAGVDGTVDTRTQANDVLLGNEGADKIFAGTGDDILHGGADNDLIVGGLGFDKMGGGTGRDTFQFRPEDVDRHTFSNGAVELSSFDQIMDFSIKDHDVVDLSGLKSLVAGNKLFFHHDLNTTEAGKVALSASDNGDVLLTVYLDPDTDADVTVEFVGLDYASTSISAMEQFILL
ncbi:hypothetical protein JQ628_03005 [Bradyrhizobium lablabi]|uniref:calcium-binding protein n=1 Tax=Bradyrhizobium lablabi TaxID=722472 RepID=UPI001BA7CA2B|nr:calcium-binding protein [Bradyrhizobium lablabi]MBR1120472.1 hypothetical protein [Bradyrhizobium lablabi]